LLCRAGYIDPSFLQFEVFIADASGAVLILVAALNAAACVVDSVTGVRFPLCGDHSGRRHGPHHDHYLRAQPQSRAHSTVHRGSWTSVSDRSISGNDIFCCRDFFSDCLFAYYASNHGNQLVFVLSCAFIGLPVLLNFVICARLLAREARQLAFLRYFLANQVRQAFHKESNLSVRLL